MNEKHTKYIAIFFAFLLIALISWAIFKQVQEHHLQDDPKLAELKEKLKPFFSTDKHWTGKLQELNHRNILNEINLYRGNKSYTINKQKVYLCLKDEHGNYYDNMTLIYVLTHEIAHCLCPNVGHTKEFHEIFEELLLEESKAGIWDPKHYIDPDYCKHGEDED